MAQLETPSRFPKDPKEWKVIHQTIGAEVTIGDTLAIVESMKMEIKIDAPISGTITALYCEAGKPVAPGQLLFAVRPKD
jgi:urea carboxylase